MFEDPNFSAIYYSVPSQSPLALVKDTVQSLRQIDPHIVLCHTGLPEGMKRGSMLILEDQHHTICSDPEMCNFFTYTARHLDIVRTL